MSNSNVLTDFKSASQRHFYYRTFPVINLKKQNTENLPR